MIEENKDQVIDEVIHGGDKSSDKQSEDTKVEEPLTPEKMSQIVKGLQKGYTLNAQALSEMRENLSTIVDAINKQSGAVSGEEQFLTVGKLKELLQEQSEVQDQRREQADNYIENVLAQMKAEGRISSKEDEDAFLNLALKIKEPDLLKASVAFDEIQKAKESGKKEAAKTKVKQEEGSKVGTSSRTSTGEQGGVDYAKVRKMDWSQF